jgi:hypothetical protein
MNAPKETMMIREDRLVMRTILGILTAPLGLILGMGLFIAL